MEGARLVMECIRCASKMTRRDGKTRLGGQRGQCNACGRRFTARSTSAFSNHGFPDDVIAVAVRWYVRYRLSYADVVEWFAERGLVVDRSTVYRWAQRFLPLFQAAARHHRIQPARNGAWTRPIHGSMGRGPTSIAPSSRMPRTRRVFLCAAQRQGYGGLL